MSPGESSPSGPVENRQAQGATSNTTPVEIRPAPTVRREAPAVSKAGREDTSVETQIRRLADRLAALFDKIPDRARYQRLAVVPFQEKGRLAREKEMGALVSALIAINLRRDHGLQVVERSQLAQVIEEVALRQAGLGGDEEAIEVGELLDVEALVLGEVAVAGDRFVVTTRIVAMETAESLVADSVEIPIADLVAFSADSIVLKSRVGAMFRAVIPGWGQYYNGEPVKAVALGGVELAALLAALGFHFSGQSIEDDYHAVDDSFPDPSGRAVRLRRRGESRYRARNALLLTAGLVWIAGLADAYFSGVDADALD